MGWTERYYDALDHYAWAPDRLGHRRDPNHALKNPAGVLKRLRRIEEPLNHIIAFFFDLAPPSIVHGLFRRFVGVETAGDLAQLGRACDSEPWLAVSTQPDFAFLGPDAFLTIECKIGSKSSLGQLLKYAALHAGAASAYPGRTHALLYLTPGDRETIFSFPFADWADVKAQAVAALLGFRTGALAGLSDRARSEICDSLGSLNIGHCTYAYLAGAIETALDSCSEGVAARLYAGMLAEIDARGLR